jgi:hypothetical protein
MGEADFQGVDMGDAGLQHRDYQGAKCANPYCWRRAPVRGEPCWQCGAERRAYAQELRVQRQGAGQ